MERDKAEQQNHARMKNLAAFSAALRRRFEGDALSREVLGPSRGSKVDGNTMDFPLPKAVAKDKIRKFVPFLSRDA